MNMKQEAIDVLNDIMLMISALIDQEENETFLNKLYDLQDRSADRILDFIDKI